MRTGSITEALAVMSLMALAHEMATSGRKGSFVAVNLAQVIAVDGLSEGRGWFRGYWYASGSKTSSHEDNLSIARIIGWDNEGAWK
jgi:hypothetical protein